MHVTHGIALRLSRIRIALMIALVERRVFTSMAWVSSGDDGAHGHVVSWVGQSSPLLPPLLHRIRLGVMVHVALLRSVLVVAKEVAWC